MRTWRTLSTFQTRSAACGVDPALDLVACLSAGLGSIPADVSDAANGFALTPLSATSYGDLLVDMHPGEERRLDPLGEVGNAPGRFSSLGEGGAAPLPGERRDWGDRGSDQAVSRGGGGIGWKALDGHVPTLHVTGSGGRLRARYDPFPVVSAAFRAVVERLDPAAAAFHPVDLRLEGGRPASGEWFLFDIVRVQQIVDLSRFRGAVAHARGALRLASRSYAFDERRDVPQDVHFLRDPLLANVELVSREARAAFAAAGVDDLAFCAVHRRGF